MWIIHTPTIQNTWVLGPDFVTRYVMVADDKVSTLRFFPYKMRLQTFNLTRSDYRENQIGKNALNTESVTNTNWHYYNS